MTAVPVRRAERRSRLQARPDVDAGSCAIWNTALQHRANNLKAREALWFADAQAFKGLSERHPCTVIVQPWIFFEHRDACSGRRPHRMNGDVE
jgi:hypothetical protein